MRRVDQRDIQKRGGRAAKYPVSYLITQLLRSINAHKILDLTYGEGRFYAYSKPSFLHGIDIQQLKWIVTPDIFEQKSLFDIYELERTYDVVVVDPPFTPHKHKKREHYTIKDSSPEAMISHACKVAKNNNIPYVLVHSRELFIPNGFEVHTCIDFVFASRYLKNEGFRNTTKFYILKQEAKAWKSYRW